MKEDGKFDPSSVDPALITKWVGETLKTAYSDENLERMLGSMDAVRRAHYKIQLIEHWKAGDFAEAEEAMERTRRLEHAITSSERAERPTVSVKIERVPGFALRDFLGLISRKKFRELVIDPTHAELVEEYQQALANGNAKHAAWLKRTMWFWLVAATGSGAIGALWSKLSVKFVSSSD